MNVGALNSTRNQTAAKQSEKTISNAQGFHALLENEAWKTAETRQTQPEASPPAEQTVKGSLTDEDYRELAKNFDPENMTWEEYDSFLDILQEKEILSEEERLCVGYHGMVVKQMDDPVSCYYLEHPMADNHPDGNVLAFTRSQGSMIYEKPLAFNEETKRLYLQVTRILERILKERRSADLEHMTLWGQTSDGKTIDLHWGNDMLASVGGTGGTVNVKYHESSTEDDPVVLIWGTDADGKEYKSIIHLNDVNPKSGTPAEMIALNTHLSKSGKKQEASAGPIALWTSLNNCAPNAKMDFKKYYEDYIATQQLAGNRSGAELYQLQLQRFLFFYQREHENAGIEAIL